MNDQLLRIDTLKNQLLELGYHQFQIDGVIKETTGSVWVENISLSLQQELITALEYYIGFAGRCNVHSKAKE
ncbi:hypothetical protein SOV_29440 [Sporomusa ovata DSM 2662]|uniref:Uncharacterized protein n=1 Tax=Sporomusa ovata TaxID=2378 RepID=A0A0U1KRQ0_9FIRM|nr:hypothetical protein [Sporomusa ovata]EQB24914.1 hypothetical protein SOV_5c00480 [Sporomusa ovata DSM 2662]CQR70110.1 hypothetical protein SpAn4DRAFT_4622 [Sporomusa ovata]